MRGIDHLDADRWSAVGPDPVLFVDLALSLPARMAVQAVVIGVDRAGELPAIDPTAYDVLLTTAQAAPRPWVAITAAQLARQIRQLEAAIRHAPVAATMLCQVLRVNEALAFAAGIQVESLAYSTLLASGEFARWRASQPETHQPQQHRNASPVRIGRDGDRLSLVLDDPATRNAMTATMRDALHEALANALDDPSCPAVRLAGAGKCFSTGGFLKEFGSAPDVALAHVVRTVRGCAAALDALGDRATAHVHGACIGSGVEIPAAAARLEAQLDAYFQLPELAMGLIPGAGGTVSVPRRIGRHRTAWMALTGQRIKAAQAFDWGLVDAVTGAP